MPWDPGMEGKCCVSGTKKKKGRGQQDCKESEEVACSAHCCEAPGLPVAVCFAHLTHSSL